jgi:glycosyltransferase involved in cell wall biosynthesis
MSKARFVILPVLSDVLKPSGISTYLQAMALGKCVVMSDSPATDGLIDGGEAVLVRPGDPVALRNAISRVANDDQYRARVAAAGRAYAWSLGGEERLADDIAECVGALVDGASHEARNASSSS